MMSAMRIARFPGAVVFTGWVVALVAAPVWSQSTRIRPVTDGHAVRVAMIGDSITFGSGTTTGGGRGNRLPGATPAQEAAAARLGPDTAGLAAAAAQQSEALVLASLTGSAGSPAIETAAEALGQAELRLAQARAESLARLQSSPDRLGAWQLAVLMQQTIPASGPGRGGAPARFVLPNTPASYPAQLAGMLGAGWDVRNFGVSGATMLKHGDRPYWNEPALAAALDFNPEVVVIMLGTNDSKPQNWKYAAEFAGDSRELIARFADLPARPAIWIAKPMPAFSAAFAISEAVIAGEVIPAIETVAREAGVGLIDQYAAMKSHGDLVPDGIHPNPDGASFLAATVFTTLTGRPAPPASGGGADR